MGIVNIVMYIVKSLEDYSKTPLEKKLAEYLVKKTTSGVCYEKIKNKDFMIKYLQPKNDFLICSTATIGSFTPKEA